MPWYAKNVLIFHGVAVTSGTGSTVHICTHLSHVGLKVKKKPEDNQHFLLCDHAKDLYYKSYA